MKWKEALRDHKWALARTLGHHYPEGLRHPLSSARTEELAHARHMSRAGGLGTRRNETPYLFWEPAVLLHRLHHSFQAPAALTRTTDETPHLLPSSPLSLLRPSYSSHRTQGSLTEKELQSCQGCSKPSPGPHCSREARGWEALVPVSP